ncbi:hypothetical protein [Streptomyces sp. 8ZJF_21]|uniref:hypothetical protein n=1 Tax=Streptomyces sp. 8ZJF_21 TaxID=2903141 RepID=UPI001E4A0567|nr:hypothetical protein [Streptomyces sp. 8ZJF_21]MCD9591259.1 hypothetical protein [Streptomyces sp. 8ZJF_21]
MTGPITLARVDELVTRSHSDGTRTFVFPTTVDQFDSACWASGIPHRWIDNITISDLVPEIDHVLRACFG